MNPEGNEAIPGERDAFAGLKPMAGMPGSETSLSDAVMTLRKRKWLILAFLFAGLLYGYYKASTQPMVYVAFGTIEIHSGARAEYRIAQSPLSEDAYDLPTQTAILKSDSLLLSVARDLDLPNNPAFGGSRTQHLSLDNPVIRQSMINGLQGSIGVGVIPKTDLVRLSCTTADPKLSAVIVNTLITEYKQRGIKARFDSTQEVSDWLSGKLDDLKQEVQTEQEQLIDLGKQVGVLGFDPSHNEVTSGLDTLSQAAGSAKIQRIYAEARLRVLKGMDPNALDASIASVGGVTSGQLQGLRAQRETLIAQLKSMDVTLLPKNSQERALRAQIDELQVQIDEEQRRLIIQAEQNLVAADVDEQQAHGALEAAKNEAYKLRDKTVEYSIAQREYDTNRQLYEGLLTRLRTAGVQAGLDSAEVDIVDAAQPPIGPSLQPRNNMLIVNGLIALAMGVILAFILETLDTSLSSVAEIENISGLPSLALIPRTRRTNETYPSAAMRNLGVLSSSKSQFAESFRALRTSLLLSVAGREPRTILLTSATPSEGKTTVSTNLAAVLSQRDVKVLLIDADLRRPTVHHRFGLNGKVGLTSILTGSMQLDGAVQQVAGLPNLDVLVSGPVPPFPTEMLGSDAMRHLLDECRDRYTHVVMDSPPLLSVTDSIVLSREADAVVLVIRYGKSTKHAVRRARDLLMRAGAQIKGLVLNAVDLSSPEYYSYYGYSGYSSYGSAGVDSKAWESLGGSSKNRSESGPGSGSGTGDGGER